MTLEETTVNEGEQPKTVEQAISEAYNEAINMPEQERTDDHNKLIDAVNEVIGVKEDVEKEADILEAMFAEEETPEVEPTEDMGVAVSNKSAIEKLKSKLNDAQKSKIIESAQKAVKTLKSVFPNMDIHFHEDDASYNAAITQNDPNAINNTAGNIMYTKGADGKYTGRIDINLGRANNRTVAHEVAHAVMLRSFGENAQLFKSFRDKISKVLSDTTNKRVNEFSDQYNETDSHEEFLVELSAALSAEEKQLDKITVSKIAKIINDVVSKLTNGAIIPFKDVNEMTDINEVVDFINSMSAAISRGEDIKIKEGKNKQATTISSRSQIIDKATSVKDIDVKSIRTLSRAGKRVSKGLSVKTVNNKKVVSEAEDLSIDYVKENAPNIYIANANIIAQFPIVEGIKKIKNIVREIERGYFETINKKVSTIKNKCVTIIPIKGHFQINARVLYMLACGSQAEERSDEDIVRLP